MTDLSLLDDPASVSRLCDDIARAGLFALDTEFVSERTYHPQLGLVQVATAEWIVAIDPLAVPDLSALWRLVADPTVTTVVHAGEQETRFCLAAAGALPGALFDVQLAAGLLGERYPLSYANLVERVVRARPRQGQARTDWLRRPLADAQLSYALEDVRYLIPLWERLRERLARLKRDGWLTEETERRLAAVQKDLSAPRWERVGGSQGFGRRALAVVREIGEWRETTAQSRDLPRGWVLPDHLITAIAQALPRAPEDLRRLRGTERIRARDVEALLAAVERALRLPESELPARRRPGRPPPQSRMLGLLLEAVLESLCAERQVDAGLVGSAHALRDLVAWRLADAKTEAMPFLLQGWRAELCGDLLEKTLSGGVALRVRDAAAEDPLAVEPWPLAGGGREAQRSGMQAEA